MSVSKRRLLIGAFIVVLVIIGLANSFEPSQDLDSADVSDVPGRFDYWILTLSWSPSYCASSQGQDDHRQCRSGRAYAFVVHGLWPQYTNGWPEFCRTKDRWVPQNLIDSMLDIMPSTKLVAHQWRKHGSCSGLDQRSYFQLTRELFGSITIPQQFVDPSDTILTTPRELEAAFLETNPDFDDAMISVRCGNQRGRANLRELWLCYGRDLKPMACGRVQRHDCRAQKLVLPPVRQGQRAHAGEGTSPTVHLRAPTR